MSQLTPKHVDTQHAASRIHQGAHSRVIILNDIT